MNLLEKNIGCTFKNKDLLEEALIHSTFVNEHKDSGLNDNQRLEFLGDTILNAAITRQLYELYPDAKEGDLTKMRALLVNETTLAKIATSLDLGVFIHLGKGEERSHGREKPSILADAYEALIGAIFLDSSFHKTYTIIKKHFRTAFSSLDSFDIDYKSTFIESCHIRYRTMPAFTLVEETGPDHEKAFAIEVSVNGETLGAGKGKTKKQATQIACKQALESLKKTA